MHSKNSNYSKGNVYEKKYMDKLVSNGYIVDRAIRRIIKRDGKFINIGSDFFGLFDLIAIKDNQILFVQVTSGNWHSKKELIDFANKTQNTHITYILAKYDKETDEFQEFVYKYVPQKNNND